MSDQNQDVAIQKVDQNLRVLSSTKDKILKGLEELKEQTGASMSIEDFLGRVVNSKWQSELNDLKKKWR